MLESFCSDNSSGAASSTMRSRASKPSADTLIVARVMNCVRTVAAGPDFIVAIGDCASSAFPGIHARPKNPPRIRASGKA